MVNTLKTFLLLAGIYALTLLFNHKHLTSTVKNYDLAAIDLLTTFENWEVEGINNYYFTPVLTWQNPGDKFVAYYKRLEDKDGNNYYTSYGALPQWLIYAIQKIFNLKATKLFIQLFAGIWHFIGGIFIYLIILLIIKSRDNKIKLPALFGFIIYSFSTTIIYANTFHFFAETFVLPLLLISFYFFLKMKANAFSNRRHFTFFLLFLSLSILSEWLGVLYASFCAIYFFKIRKSLYKPYTKIIWISLVTVFTILLIIFQYSLIIGIEHLQDTMSLRFLERTGYFGDKYSDQQISIVNPISYLLLIKQINNLFMPWGYIVIAGLLISYIKFKVSVLKKYKFILFLVLFPALLHYIIFFNANTLHLFYLTKFIPAISISGGILFFIFQEKIKNQLSLILIIITVLVTGLIFSFINYKKVIPVYDDTPILNNAAAIINEIAEKDESIFIQLDGSEPSNTILYLSYVTKRNMVMIKNDTQAKDYLTTIPNKKGILFDFDFDKDVRTYYSIKRF